MTIRWGIIGCGDVCEVKSGPAFYRCRGSALTSVMRRDRAKAEDFARRHGVAHAGDDARALIERDDVDAVYIATPPGAHLEWALAVAAVGKPCYVEKPMARNATECRRMLSAFEAAGLGLYVGYYRRGLPRCVAVKTALAGGAIGRLQQVRYQLAKDHKKPFTPADWHLHAEASGGGLFMDLGCHALDLIDFIAGPIANYHGHAALLHPDLQRRQSVPDTINMSGELTGGALISCDWNFAADQPIDRLQFIGHLGEIELSVFGAESALLRRPGCDPEPLSQDHPQHVHQPLVQTIVDELQGGTNKCPSTGSTALRTAVVMDQILLSYYGDRDEGFWRREAQWPGRRRAQIPTEPPMGVDET